MTEFESMLQTAESALESIAGDGDGSDGTDDHIESVVGDLEAIETVLDEAETILESIDLTELPDAIDEDQLLDAIETGEIPDAVRDSEDAEVVKLRQVIRAINMRELLGAADVSQLWEAKRSLDDATDELARSGEAEDAGMVEEAAATVKDDESLIGDEDDELVETDADDLMETGVREAMDDFEIEGGDLSEYEELIQQQAIEGVDAFRDALLKAHGKFERVVEENRERTRNIDRTTNSRSPTAVSTITTDRADLASTPNYSTMPRQVRHSSAPSRRQIYGDRFRQERQKRGYD